MNARIALFCLAAVANLAAGCAKSDDSQMTSSDAANFKGGKGTPMSDAQKKAMGDFQAEFKRKHPTTGPAPGQPPTTSPSGTTGQ